MLRVFICGGDHVTVVTPAPGVEEAYDLLVAGGVASQKAADLTVGFARIGKDPVFQAKKFLRLRASIM